MLLAIAVWSTIGGQGTAGESCIIPEPAGISYTSIFFFFFLPPRLFSSSSFLAATCTGSFLWATSFSKGFDPSLTFYFVLSLSLCCWLYTIYIIQQVSFVFLYVSIQSNLHPAPFPAQSKRIGFYYNSFSIPWGASIRLSRQGDGAPLYRPSFILLSWWNQQDFPFCFHSSTSSCCIYTHRDTQPTSAHHDRVERPTAGNNSASSTVLIPFRFLPFGPHFFNLFLFYSRLNALIPVGKVVMLFVCDWLVIPSLSLVNSDFFAASKRNKKKLYYILPPCVYLHISTRCIFLFCLFRIIVDEY